MQGKSEYTRLAEVSSIALMMACRQTALVTTASPTTSTFGMSLSIKIDKKGLCPLYARLLHMWSRLDDSYHGCDMDNLYTVVSLARNAYSLPKPILIEGVMRKN